jgi:hypothetical protein
LLPDVQFPTKANRPEPLAGFGSRALPVFDFQPDAIVLPHLPESNTKPFAAQQTTIRPLSEFLCASMRSSLKNAPNPQVLSQLLHCCPQYRFRLKPFAKVLEWFDFQVSMEEVCRFSLLRLKPSDASSPFEG